MENVLEANSDSFSLLRVLRHDSLKRTALPSVGLGHERDFVIDGFEGPTFLAVFRSPIDLFFDLVLRNLNLPQPARAELATDGPLLRTSIPA